MVVPSRLEDLFVRHTYLTAVAGIAVQARFRINIAMLAETDPGDLIVGHRFRDQTGLQGVVETDFFSWPSEVGGEPLLRAIASPPVALRLGAGDRRYRGDPL